MTTVVAAGAVACAAAGQAHAHGGVSPPTISGTVAGLPPHVFVQVLPQGTTVNELASVPGMSIGFMSTGIGKVPPEQTYLDVSQGNRVDDALYDASLPALRDFGRQVPRWAQIADRADAAPADIVPGLLASSLLSHGIRSDAVPAAESAALMVADRTGVVGRENFGNVSVFAGGIGEARKHAALLPGDYLLIVFAEPASGDETVPIGIVGRGFDGNLTSDSTRTDGYVLSTDIAPTILRRFGLPIPDEMNGEPIRAAGSLDPGAIEDRADRMAAIPGRRAPVVILSLAAWILAAASMALIRPALRRSALAWLALAFAYMPLMLLAGAAVEPTAVAEGLMIGFGAAALAASTLVLTRGWWALAIACGITVLAYAIDVATGSELTKLSLLGPNPIFGVRFYGIGNELEALIAVMVPVAVGAGLSAYTGWGRVVSQRAAAAAFLLGGGLAAVVFAAGRFGADVGAAIVLPVGAAVAVACLSPNKSFGAFAHYGPANRPKLESGRRWPSIVVAVFAAPIVAIVLLAFIDLVSGGNAHLTRSVLDAGGTGDLADIAERRLRLSAHDFAHAAGNPLFWVVLAGIAVAIFGWRRIGAWLQPFPAARAGLIGACAAVAVGVLVNDSGATFLVLGSLALGATLAFAWAQAGGDP